MKIQAIIPCCQVHTTVNDRLKPQDRRCPKCKTWWRVDVRLLHQTSMAGNAISSLHEVNWTQIGVLS